MRRAPRRRARSSPWRGTLRLALVFAALVGVNAYFFLFRRGTSVNDLVRLSENHQLAAAVAPPPKKPARPPAPPVPAAPRSAAPRESPPRDEGRSLGGMVAEGETVATLLGRA